MGLAQNILSCECKVSKTKPKGNGIIKDQHEFQGCTCQARMGNTTFQPSLVVVRVK